jgi:uncharacterized protein (DUF302 family)
MDDVVVAESRFEYAETIERLSAKLLALGATLFAKIDQRLAADTVGLALRPTTLFIFGNPRGGTPLMRDYPLLALELPLKLLVWEDAGTVHLAHAMMNAVGRRYGVPQTNGAIAALDRTLDELVASVT